MVNLPPEPFPDDNLVDKLLEDQGKLQTPVAQFAEKHDEGSIRTDLYKHLIPLEKPGPGEQYAFQVSLDRCTGCKACVVACHTLNGLDEEEAWRDVGLLEGGGEGGDSEPGFQQTVTSACHHCLEPECLHGCPVKAYEKEPDTGIVRHLDDQCIGCEYCVLKCPYDVPKYSTTCATNAWPKEKHQLASKPARPKPSRSSKSASPDSERIDPNPCPSFLVPPLHTSLNPPPATSVVTSPPTSLPPTKANSFPNPHTGPSASCSPSLNQALAS